MSGSLLLCTGVPQDSWGQGMLNAVVSTDAGAPLAEQNSRLQFDGCTTVPFMLNETLSLSLWKTDYDPRIFVPPVPQIFP